MNRIGRGAALALLAAGLLACDTPTDPSAERVTFSYSPEPAIAERSTGKFYVVEGDSDEPDETFEYPWKTSFTLYINEENGTGLDIVGVTVRVQQATGGIITPPSRGQEYYEYLSQALSGNHIAGNGQGSMRFDVWYDLPNDGAESVVTLSFTFVDDDDLTVTDSVQVRVQ